MSTSEKSPGVHALEGPDALTRTIRPFHASTFIGGAFVPNAAVGFSIGLQIASGARRQIVCIHLRRRGRKPDDFDVDALVEASAGFSGAEIEQAIIAAMHDAFAERRELDTDRIRSAMAASPPLSVTMAERVSELRRWAAGRCVPAD